MSERTQEMAVRAVRPLAEHDHTSLEHLTEEALREYFLSLKYDPVYRLFNTPKNGCSRRVEMSQELHTALLDLRQRRFAAAVFRGMPASRSL